MAASKNKNEKAFLKSLDKDELEIYMELRRLKPEQLEALINDTDNELILDTVLKASEFKNGGMKLFNGTPFKNVVQQLSVRDQLGRLPTLPNVQDTLEIERRLAEREFGEAVIESNPITGQLEVLARGEDGNFYPIRSKGGVLDNLYGKTQDPGGLFNQLGEFAGDVAEGKVKGANLINEGAFQVGGGALGALASLTGVPGVIGAVGGATAGGVGGNAVAGEAGRNIGIGAGGLIGAISGTAGATVAGRAIGAGVGKYLTDYTELASAHAQGLVTDDEFDALGSDLLNQAGVTTLISGGIDGVLGLGSVGLKTVQNTLTKAGAGKATIAKVNKQVQNFQKQFSGSTEEVTAKLGKQYADADSQISKAFDDAYAEFGIKGASIDPASVKSTTKVDPTSIIEKANRSGDPNLKAIVNRHLNEGISTDAITGATKYNSINPGKVYLMNRELDEVLKSNSSNINRDVVFKEILPESKGIVDNVPELATARALRKQTTERFGSTTGFQSELQDPVAEFIAKAGDIQKRINKGDFTPDVGKAEFSKLGSEFFSDPSRINASGAELLKNNLTSTERTNLVGGIAAQQFKPSTSKSFKFGTQQFSKAALEADPTPQGFITQRPIGSGDTLPKSPTKELIQAGSVQPDDALEGFNVGRVLDSLRTKKPTGQTPIQGLENIAGPEPVQSLTDQIAALASKQSQFLKPSKETGEEVLKFLPFNAEGAAKMLGPKSVENIGTTSGLLSEILNMARVPGSQLTREQINRLRFSSDPRLQK